MKSRYKIGLSALFPTAIAGAITPLATACSNVGTIIQHVHESSDDIKYGLNASTYKQIKKDYESKLASNMVLDGIQKDSSLWNSKMSNLKLALNTFDNKAASTSMSYSTLTSSLMNYARLTDGISLRRVTNTKWSDINALFQGAYDSFELYMSHEHFSDSKKKQILTDAKNKFNTKLAQLEANGYKETDPFGALQEVRTELITYFDEVNEKIGFLSAQQNLSNFIAKYHITYKGSEAPLNQIRTELTSSVGTVMSDNLFNKIFKLVDLETGQLVTFSSNLMIPGYTIMPKLKSFSQDDKTNKFVINVEYSAIKTSILNSNKNSTEKQRITAQVYDFGNTLDTYKTISSNSDVSDDQLFNTINNLKIEPFEYQLLNKTTEENTAIENIYFNKSNDKYIRFMWPKQGQEGFDECNIDRILTNIPYDKRNEEATLSMVDLADLGLRISQDGVKWFTLKQAMFSGINKMIHNLSPDDVPVEDCLIDEFARNCNLTAKVKFNGSTTSSYTVSTQFGVSYLHTLSSKQDFNDLYQVNANDFVTGQIENYPISNGLFNQLCSRYTKVDEQIKIFNNQANQISKTINLITLWVGGLASVITISVALMGVLTFKAISGGLTSGLVFGYIAGAACIAMAGVAQHLLLSNIKPPIQSYSDRLTSVQNKNFTKKLQDVKEAHKNLFVIYDDQGNCADSEYEEKLTNFKSLSIDDKWQYASYYLTLYEVGNDGYEFMQALDDNKINSEEFEQVLLKFSKRDTDYNTCLSLTCLEIPMQLLTLFLAIFDGKNKNDEKGSNKLDGPDVDEAAKEASDKIDDVAKQTEQVNKAKSTTGKMEETSKYDWSQDYRRTDKENYISFMDEPQKASKVQSKLDAFNDVISGNKKAAWEGLGSDITSNAFQAREDIGLLSDKIGRYVKDGGDIISKKGWQDLCVQWNNCIDTFNWDKEIKDVLYMIQFE